MKNDLIEDGKPTHLGFRLLSGILDEVYEYQAEYEDEFRSKDRQALVIYLTELMKKEAGKWEQFTLDHDTLYPFG